MPRGYHRPAMAVVDLPLPFHLCVMVFALLFGALGALDPAPFAAAVENFYMTDPISRASETMAKCTEAFMLGRGGEATGTDG